ncbi:MAG: hypothetical protein JXA03_10485 [Bacteroidales bacterium]|nr:hypothetical protein [Bacteroidales bacterium]
MSRISHTIHSREENIELLCGILAGSGMILLTVSACVSKILMIAGFTCLLLIYLYQLMMTGTTFRRTKKIIPALNYISEIVLLLAIIWSLAGYGNGKILFYCGWSLALPLLILNFFNQQKFNSGTYSTFQLRLGITACVSVLIFLRIS